MRLDTLKAISLNNRGQIVMDQPSLFSFFYQGTPYLVQAVHCRLKRDDKLVTENHLRVIGVIGHAPLALSEDAGALQRLKRILDDVQERRKYATITLNPQRLLIKVFEIAINGPFNDTNQLLCAAIQGVLIDSDIVYDIRQIIQQGQNQ